MLVQPRYQAPNATTPLGRFFFQAADGIRDRNVTGVQTCALPIWAGSYRETTDMADYSCCAHRRFRRSTPANAATAPSTAAPTSTGARRFATEPPAYSIRSIASAFDVLDESGTACSGGRWSCCSPVECPVADVAAVVEAASVPVVPCGCDGAAASSDVVDAPSSAANESANEFRILPPTSEIIPLPNCAGRPVTLRSVATAPLVPSPSDANVTVTVADAVPAPLA